MIGSQAHSPRGTASGADVEQANTARREIRKEERAKKTEIFSQMHGCAWYLHSASPDDGSGQRLTPKMGARLRARPLPWTDRGSQCLYQRTPRQEQAQVLVLMQGRPIAAFPRAWAHLGRLVGRQTVVSRQSEFCQNREFVNVLPKERLRCCVTSKQCDKPRSGIDLSC